MFTQLNLQGKSGSGKTTEITPPGQQARPSSQPSILREEKRKAAVFGTLMVAAFAGAVLLGANGCSQQTKKSVEAIPAHPPEASQPATALAPAAPAPTAVATSNPATKPSRQHKPGSYSNASLGVSFEYPWQYGLTTGNRANLAPGGGERVPMNFVQPGGHTLSVVEVPQGYFPETNFRSALFNLSVNPKLSVGECEQFAFTESGKDESTAEPGKVRVGETEYTAIATDDPAARYYHLYQNGMCYEFGLAMQTAGEDVNTETRDKIKSVNPDKVFGRLETILSTVKINPVEGPSVPEVATKAEAKPESDTQ